MEVPKTIDIASLFYFSAANRDGGKGPAAVADATTKKESGYISSNQQEQEQEQQNQLELEQMTMETLHPTWRDALQRSSVMANSIRHFVEPDVHTEMDRDIGLWIALEEDIMSLGSDDSNDLDYGADDDLDNDDDDDDESVSSGGSSELSDGGYIVDEPNPFGQLIVAGKGKGKGSIVDDWTDDEEACSSDVSNWSDDNGGKKKKKKKKSKKAASGSAKSSNGSRKKVLVSSKSGTQKQLSAFGIKMTITNKTGDEGGGSGAKKRKSTGTTASTTAKKKKRGKKKAPSTAAPDGKVRSETDKKPYSIGSSIVLRNLTANDVARLNGKRAVVRSAISYDGKQEIEVEGQEGLIPMKLENMRGVCPLFG